MRKKVYEKEEEREEAEVSTVVGGIDPEAFCESQIGTSRLVHELEVNSQKAIAKQDYLRELLAIQVEVWSQKLD